MFGSSRSRNADEELQTWHLPRSKPSSALLYCLQRLRCLTPQKWIARTSNHAGSDRSRPPYSAAIRGLWVQPQSRMMGSNPGLPQIGKWAAGHRLLPHASCSHRFDASRGARHGWLRAFPAPAAHSGMHQVE